MDIDILLLTGVEEQQPRWSLRPWSSLSFLKVFSLSIVQSTRKAKRCHVSGEIPQSQPAKEETDYKSDESQVWDESRENIYLGGDYRQILQLLSVLTVCDKSSLCTDIQTPSILMNNLMRTGRQNG